MGTNLLIYAISGLILILLLIRWRECSIRKDRRRQKQRLYFSKRLQDDSHLGIESSLINSVDLDAITYCGSRIISFYSKKITLWGSGELNYDYARSYFVKLKINDSEKDDLFQALIREAIRLVLHNAPQSLINLIIYEIKVDTKKNNSAIKCVLSDLISKSIIYAKDKIEIACFLEKLEKNVSILLSSDSFDYDQRQEIKTQTDRIVKLFG